MKNKLTFLFNSLKQSIVNKPIAFILLILIFLATTVCCCLPSRYATNEILVKYSNDASSLFEMKASKFKENRMAIIDYIKQQEQEIDHNGNMWCSMTIMQYDCNLKINGSPTKFDYLSVKFRVVAQPNDLENKGNVCNIGDSIARKYGIAEGSTINIYNTDFVVQKIYVDENGIYLPHDAKIDNWYSFSPPPDPFSGKTYETRPSIYVNGISHEEMSVVHSQMRKFGCKRDNTDMAGLTQSFIMVLAMLLIGMVASTTVMWYWLKCNSKKYSTYKTLGCSPAMLAFTMIIETLLIALFAISIGLFVDFILSIAMQETIVIAGFEWLHYLLLIGGSLSGILIITIVAVTKRALAMPANSKYKI